MISSPENRWRRGARSRSSRNCVRRRSREGKTPNFLIFRSRRPFATRLRLMVSWGPLNHLTGEKKMLFSLVTLIPGIPLDKTPERKINPCLFWICFSKISGFTGYWETVFVIYVLKPIRHNYQPAATCWECNYNSNETLGWASNWNFPKVQLVWRRLISCHFLLVRSALFAEERKLFETKMTQLNFLARLLLIVYFLQACIRCLSFIVCKMLVHSINSTDACAIKFEFKFECAHSAE